MNQENPDKLSHAVALYQSNRLREAETAILELIHNEADKGRPDVWHIGAIIALRLRNLPIALRRIENALKIDENNAEYFNTKGAVLLELKKYQESFEAFTKASELKPDYVEAVRNRGLPLKMSGQLVTAERLLLETVTRFPADGTAWELLSETQLDQRRIPPAIESAKRALEITPKHPTPHALLIRALQAGEYSAQAEDAINKALETLPGNPQIEEFQAINFAKTGSINKSVSYFERRLQNEPDSVSLKCNLALAVLKSQNLDRARLLISEILKPSKTASGNILGLAKELSAHKLWRDTVAVYQFVLRSEPKNLTALVGLARAFIATDHKNEATQIINSLQLNDSRNVHALLIKAELAINEADLDLAIRTLRRLVAVDPTHLEGCRLLAEQLLKSSGVVGAVVGTGSTRGLRLEEALIMTHRVLEFSENPELLLLQARVLHSLFRQAEAIVVLEQAIELSNDDPEIHCLLGLCCLDLGDVDRARTCFEAALQLDPHHARSHYQLAVGLKHDNPEERLGPVLKIIEDKTQSKSTSERIQLHFAAARYYDAQKDYDRAFEHYLSANELKPRPKPNYSKDSNANRHHNDMREIAEVFTKEFFEERAGWGLETERPIFIIGMPRSGTTLTEQILSSHPEVFGAGERQEISELPRLMERLCTDRYERFPDVARELKEHDFLFLARRHDRILSSLAPQSRYITDKMPTNFIHLGLISVIFPNARIIDCQRNPRDIAVSSMRQNLDWPFCDLEQIGHYINAYEDLMRHWHATISNPIHSLVYEDLVQSPQDEIRRLLAFCNLEWDDACLEFQNSKRTVITPSKAQVRQPMYTSSINAWKRYETHLEPLLKVLNR